MLDSGKLLIKEVYLLNLHKKLRRRLIKPLVSIVSIVFLLKCLITVSKLIN